MATPNIVNVATINAKNATGAVTTSRAVALDVSDDTVAKVNTILICNIDGSNAADITIEVSVDNGSNYVKIASTISVPADATLSFLENPIYLDETDHLAVTASANSDLTYFISYEELNDAQEVLQAMANGGIIGPVQTVTSNVAENRTTSFTSNGCFTAQTGTKEVDYLLVAGGGGGCNTGCRARGGGGGGGLLTSFPGGTKSPVNPGGVYPVVVGAGGTGGAGSPAGTNSSTPGVATTFNCISTVGGGEGNAPGGSGGGGNSYGNASGAAGTCGQGYPGGAGNCNSNTPVSGSFTFVGGGGGGAGGAGGDGTNPGGTVTSGAGGAVATNSITGSSVSYAGGGSGGAQRFDPNPKGVAIGASTPVSGDGQMFGQPGGGSGTANTGGGGGGGASLNPSNLTTTSGAGGSGVAVIREYVNTIRTAPGVWSLNEVYDNVKAADWTNTNQNISTVDFV